MKILELSPKITYNLFQLKKTLNFIKLMPQIKALFKIFTKNKFYKSKTKTNFNKFKIMKQYHKLKILKS